MSVEDVGLISEHEPRGASESKAPGYQPDEEQQKTIKMAEMLYQKAKNGRKEHDQKWVDYYRMYRGKQWKEQRPAYRHSEVFNLVWRAIQSEVPLLTDALPKPQFEPENPNDYELSQILNKVLEGDWNYNNWTYKFAEILYDSRIGGTGLGGMGFDPKACDGLGSVKFQSEDFFYQFPDPSARNVNDGSRFYVAAEPVDIEVLKQEYPEVAKYLKPDITDLMKKDEPGDDMLRYKAPNNDRLVYEGSSPYDLGGKQEALKITVWVKDMESVEEEFKELDPATQQEKITTVSRLKYPNGRRIVIVSKVLCEDVPMDEPEGKFPRLRLQNYINPREFWGISEVEQLESPQKTYNKIMSFVLDALTITGNPIWKVPTTAGIDTDNLYNRPGLIMEYDGEIAPSREAGVELQGYILPLFDRVKQIFDDISGSNDVSRGVKPEGITAASAIEALQEAQQTRMRQKARNIDAFMQEFGQMYLGYVFENYTVPRIFRITDNQNVTQYFKFHVDSAVDPVTNETRRTVRVNDFTPKIDPMTGQELGGYAESPERQYVVMGRFDVKIGTGSALPFEKSRIEQQSYALFDRGVIDAEEVLNNIKYPNAKSVLARIEQKAMMQAQAQMAPAAGPAQAPVPEPSAPVSAA